MLVYETASMDVSEVERRLGAHVESDPYKTSAAYWSAEEALDQQVSGVSPSLLTAYFEKVQQVWPEVGPRLDRRDADTLRAWAKAAIKRPELRWNAVLLHYWREDPRRLAHAFTVLKTLYGAPSDPEPLSLPADPELVQAFRHAMPLEAPGEFPTGWAATVLQEGSEASVDAVKTYIVDPVEDVLLDGTLDDLKRLVTPPLTPKAAELLSLISGRLQERDDLNGQEVFFRSLGLQEIPSELQFQGVLVAKSGHRFTLTLSRSWRSSLLSWSMTVGKEQARYTVTDRALLVNKMKLEPYGLLDMEALLRKAAEQLKTRWVGPWQSVVEQGLSDFTGRLDQCFAAVVAESPAKPKRAKR